MQDSRPDSRDDGTDSPTDRTDDGAATPVGSSAYDLPEDVDRKGTAVVARRADPGGDPDTTEIAALAAAAGYQVAGACSQTRPEDPGTNLGAGKVEEFAALAAAANADVAVIDGELTPAQTVALSEALPAGTEVLDRYRLVLRVFAEGAGSQRARLQVEYARLRYELPLIKERTGLHVMSRRTEKGTPIQDVENRIAEVERTLERLPSPAERHRERRREQGFDLVTVAGYTNAGKSTLLHRLADDLSVEGLEPDHPDEDATAAVADRLFKTLETTTRKATIDGRRALVTDTVGFVDDLPHDLVESFSATLSEVSEADAVVLVADASDPPDVLRGKLDTAMTVMAASGAEDPLVALNKADLLDADELAARRAAVADGVDDPVEVSAIEGTGVDGLRSRIRGELPTDHAELSVPGTDEAMRLVSWAYDHAEVLDIEYGERVRLELSGRPDVLDRARGMADRVGE